jgi:transposase
VKQVDNAPAHTSEEIEIPDNVIAFYQPSYCPEVNSIERLWQYIKNFFAWQNFQTLDELRKKLDTKLYSFSQDELGCLTG